MHGQWLHKKVLIVVRTYPTPARKGIEVSCTAGITEDGQWIRIFPLPYRLLPSEKRFHKYQWIELDVKKANDARPESFYPNLDSINVVSQPISTRDNWQNRKDIVMPLKAHCLCCLKKARDQTGNPTLGVIKPKTISGLVIEKVDSTWSAEQLARLRQMPLFGNLPSQELEKLPYAFSYRFTCQELGCPSHELVCTDWEMGESYRNWSKAYGPAWESYFRQRYETEMILERDTSFYVGTMHEHPDSWIIIGLFYPRLVQT